MSASTSPVISWTDDMKLGIAFQDDDHREAVDMINALAQATGDDLLGLCRHFLTHCEEHFGREDEMMRQTGFFALVPHSGEHARVLDELRQVVANLEAGDPQPDYFRQALPAWFRGHLESMDAVTANFARQRGFTG
ncbi:MAG: bacteriohemerythrin [Actinomycetota bacterium]